MEQTLFYILIIIIIIGYLSERILEYLNHKHSNITLPDELRDVYDSSKYEQQQQYEHSYYRFSLLSSTFSVLMVLAMFLFEGFALLDNTIRQFTTNPVWLALLFLGILLFASDILNLPFSLYSTFVIEEKFGFNRTTPKTYLLDKLKGWLLSIVIGGGILSFIIWLYLKTTDMFWLYAWLTVSLVSIFMSLFYSSLIVPMFNKQTPIPDGELRREIEGFCNKVGFSLKNIYEIDGSKRSNKSNAYFSGMGRQKRIVLYDTLIKDLTVKQLTAVLAHEVGHYKKKHIVSGMFLGILHTGILFFILSLFIGLPELTRILNPALNEASFHLGLIAFGILYSPISTVTGLLMNILSRKHEYQADRFAKENYEARELIAALKKLSSHNLSNPTPHPIYVFINYSHPTLLQRIRALASN